MTSLNGIHVLVTRPAHQAQPLCELIEQHGGIPVQFPTIAIAACDQIPSIQQTLAALEKFNWLIFVSTNAVNFALNANNGKIVTPKTLRLAAIGKATADALRQAGLSVDLMPQPPYTSEALLIMPELQTMQGQQVLIVRGEGGREQLATVLQQRGAVVHYLNVYKRIMPDINNSEVRLLLAQNRLNVITATSGEILQNLLTLLDSSDHAALFNLPLVVVSDRIKHIAQDMGFKHIAVTEQPSDQAMLETIKTRIITEQGE